MSWFHMSANHQANIWGKAAQKWPNPYTDNEAGHNVRSMRKTFTLVLASVLATGAVQAANADTFTVIDDPENYISIGEISKPWGQQSQTKDLGPLDAEEEIEPVAGNFPDNNADSNFHRIPLEVKRDLGDKPLDHVSVCFYDSIELNTSELINTNCGDGTEANPVLPVNPFSAQPFVITSLTDPVETPPTLTKTAGEVGEFVVQQVYPKLGAGQHRSSTFVVNNTFRGETVTGEDVLSASISFRLTDAAFNSAGWKVRVVATYDDATLELVSDRTYTVRYFGSLSSTRGVVEYGDVLPGGEKKVEGIATGTYRANNVSDIMLTAEPFTLTGDANGLAFGNSATPDVGEVSLACRPNLTAEFDNFFTSGDELSIVLLSGLPDVKSSQITAPSNRITAATHDCKLFVGGEVATGSYSNSMTLSIGGSPE